MPLFRLLPVVLLAAACGDVLYLEGSVNQLCQRMPAQPFSAPTTNTLERRFDFDITANLPSQLERAQLTIGLERMTVTANGATDLRFIEAAQVTLEPPPRSKLPPRVVVRASEPNPRQLQFEGDDFELAPYLQSGVLSYTVVLSSSTMPATTVAADIDACANVALRWDYAR